MLDLERHDLAIKASPIAQYVFHLSGLRIVFTDLLESLEVSV